MGRIKDEFFSGGNYERYEYYKKLMSYTGFHYEEIIAAANEERYEKKTTVNYKFASIVLRKEQQTALDELNDF